LKHCQDPFATQEGHGREKRKRKKKRKSVKPRVIEISKMTKLCATGGGGGTGGVDLILGGKKKSVNQGKLSPQGTRPSGMGGGKQGNPNK